jgi:hypothetical protein
MQVDGGLIRRVGGGLYRFLFELCVQVAFFFCLFYLFSLQCLFFTFTLTSYIHMYKRFVHQVYI